MDLVLPQLEGHQHCKFNFSDQQILFLTTLIKDFLPVFLWRTQEMIGDFSMLLLLWDGISMLQDNMETSARETRCFHVRFYFKIWFFEQIWGSQPVPMNGVNIFWKAFKNLCLVDSAAALVSKAGLQGSTTQKPQKFSWSRVEISICIHVLDLLLQFYGRQHTFVAMAPQENQLLLKWWTVYPREGPKVQGTKLLWEINFYYATYFKIYQSDPSSHHFQTSFELAFP